MNVLLITSDQHNASVMGCAGDASARTPHLDRFAEAGTLFDAAYTNNPICMPARATLATGRYGSSIGSVDNGTAYDGRVPSWGHRVRDVGGTAVTFGKLHFDPEADHGFDARLPLQAKRGYAGALLGWARGDAPSMGALRRNVEAARPGEFEYTTYDRYTAASAVEWLRSEAPRSAPWAAHVSFAYPHYPFRVPATYLEDLDEASIPLPPQWRPVDWPIHPSINYRRHIQRFELPPVLEVTLRRMRYIYYGMVSFLDEQVGRVLDALDASGMAENTLIIYTSDHGDMLGEKGLFMKGLMYEGSARVPMIVAGADVPAGVVQSTPVSLIDVAPTVLAAIGTEPDEPLPGSSLVALATAPETERVVFSEYHGPSSIAANFMVRKGTTKYIEYLAPNTPPQLFDLADDPREENDLAATHLAAVADMAAELRKIVDPEGLDAQIREQQQQALIAAGGLASIQGDAWGAASGGRLGGYTVPSDEIMETVGWPDDPDWADR